MNDSQGTAWASLRKDMNLDAQFTLTDIWLWIVQIFFLPGDAVVWLLSTYLPGLARFLELGTASYGGLFSAIASTTIWLFTIVILGALYGAVLNIDRALTIRITGAFREFTRRTRVARIWFGCQSRRFLATFNVKPAPSDSTIDFGELDLGELDLEVLRSHALLAPGYVLSISDLATSLEIRRTDAQRVIDKLEKLALLKRSFSTHDGETGYTLSHSGQFVLMARSRLASR